MGKTKGDMHGTQSSFVCDCCNQWNVLSTDEFYPCLLCVRVANHPRKPQVKPQPTLKAHPRVGQFVASCIAIMLFGLLFSCCTVVQHRRAVGV